LITKIFGVIGQLQRDYFRCLPKGTLRFKYSKRHVLTYVTICTPFLSL